MHITYFVIVWFVEVHDCNMEIYAQIHISHKTDSDD